MTLDDQIRILVGAYEQVVQLIEGSAEPNDAALVNSINETLLRIPAILTSGTVSEKRASLAGLKQGAREIKNIQHAIPETVRYEAVRILKVALERSHPRFTQLAQVERPNSREGLYDGHRSECDAGGWRRRAGIATGRHR